MEPLLVSIVISTYRRNEMLRDTLLSLCGMNRPQHVTMEVIVVDNDPDGGAGQTTSQLVASCSHSFGVRYVHESRAGVSHARNRGIAESRGEVIAFLDDDVFVAAHWLSALLNCFQRTGADAVGGRTLVHWDGEPEAAVRACERPFVAVDFGEHDRQLSGAEIPGGGNAAFRRGVFERGLQFPLALSRVGNTLVSGEDSEIFRHLQLSGRTVWYCADAVIRHRIGGERLTGEYLTRRQYWSGISYALIDRRMSGKATQVANALARALKALLILIPHLLWAVLGRDAGRQLLFRCYLAKQWGYARATFGSVQDAWASASSASETEDPGTGASPAKVGVRAAARRFSPVGRRGCLLQEEAR